jgi:hypothetical protein
MKEQQRLFFVHLLHFLPPASEYRFKHAHLLDQICLG